MKPLRLLSLGALLLLGGCAASPPPPTTSGDLPFEPPYEVAVPNYEGSLKDLMPERVGAFTRSESKEALALQEALAAWSAFYRGQDYVEIHLRIQRFASWQLAC